MRCRFGGVYQEGKLSDHYQSQLPFGKIEKEGAEGAEGKKGGRKRKKRKYC